MCSVSDGKRGFGSIGGMHGIGQMIGKLEKK